MELTGVESTEAWANSAKFKKLTSSQRLLVLKRRLPLATVFSNPSIGREYGPIRKYLTNGQLGDTEVKLLRNYLKLVVGRGGSTCCEITSQPPALGIMTSLM